MARIKAGPGFNPRRLCRFWQLRLSRLPGSPHSLALGTAVGAFIAATPTIPLHTTLIIAATFLLGGNFIAAYLASMIVSNPFTIPVQYYLAWKLGSFLLPGRLNKDQFDQLLHLVHHTSLLALFTRDQLMQTIKPLEKLGGEALLVLLTGGLILAVPVGIGSYLLALRFFIGLDKKKRQKHLLTQ